MVYTYREIQATGEGSSEKFKTMEREKERSTWRRSEADTGFSSVGEGWQVSDNEKVEGREGCAEEGVYERKETRRRTSNTGQEGQEQGMQKGVNVVQGEPKPRGGKKARKPFGEEDEKQM